MTVIRVEQVSKVYRSAVKDAGLVGAIKNVMRPRYMNKVAVDGVSFEVEAGEMVGYIGVNGAGKSTTIKMLTGILVPTSGHIDVLGREPHRQRTANAREIGVVFGQRTQMWWDLAFIESLNLTARIYQIPPERYKQMLERFTDILSLDELFPLSVRNMSLGQKMRAELAVTLIHEPRILYLDEPTIGLDLVVKERIRAFIKEQNRANGTTLILTTHDLGDIEELCPRVIIIDAGKLIYDGPISAIRERFGTYRTLTFEVVGAIGAFDVPAGAEVEMVGEQRVVIRFDRTRTTASQVAASLMNQLEVVDFSLAEPDLASIIRQIYGGALRTPQDMATYQTRDETA